MGQGPLLAPWCPRTEPQARPPLPCPSPAPASSPRWWISRPKGIGRSSWIPHVRTSRSRTGECLGQGPGGGCHAGTPSPPCPPPPRLDADGGADPLLCRFAARPDCGSKYQLCVQLLSSAHAPLGTFQPDPATIQKKSDAKWREVCGLTLKQGETPPHDVPQVWVPIPALWTHPSSATPAQCSGIVLEC